MAVYLVHLDTPFKHAQHYLGYSTNVERRFAHHQDGSGANFLRVVMKAGITFRLARVWADGDRALETRLRRTHHRRRYCPICQATGAGQ